MLILHRLQQDCTRLASFSHELLDFPVAKASEGPQVNTGVFISVPCRIKRI